MASTTHRRRLGRKTKVISGIVAAAAVAGGAFALAGSASAATVGAAYSTTSDWSTGYTGQYAISNDGSSALDGWKLTFQLPAGTTIDTLWNGKYTVSGQTVTVTPESWNGTIAPGAKASVGFTTDVKGGSNGPAAAPAGCTINGAKCSVDDQPPSSPTGRPTDTATPTQAPTQTPTQTPTATPTTPGGGSGTAPGTGSAASGGFSPYVDTSLYPAFDLAGAMKANGTKEFNLAFVLAGGGGCTPKWGGSTDLGSDAVAAQIGAVRDAGGDVRVSFGGANGTELAGACTSASDLATAYGKVIDQYKLTKVDFDIEGAALSDAAAVTRRDQAIAQLQKSHSGLEVSYTLPVLPTGLTQDGTNLLADAKTNGVDVHAVNVMAMDYGSSFTGDMGQYAIDAATATQSQVKSVLGLSDDAAWKAVAVTPMIGVNDTNTETFTVADAGKLVDFAKSKGLAWLSMWSAARDKQCPGGAQGFASPTCSSITQGDGDFSKALGAYTG